jgi:uroporphyrin-III C-methyltransferase
VSDLPFVSFVGAGPGEADLITLKGLRRIRDAAVIIHDSLVAAALLEHARADAELIDAGKGPGRHGLGQPEINRLLVDRARRRGQIVRLESGDPGVFARLADEIEVVRTAGIGFEIVPGVTAALAAAARVGISLAERGRASTLVLAAGNDAPASVPALDWELLARAEGTLVFYVGVDTLGPITATLTALGRDAREPALIVERCGLPEERIVAARLGDVAARGRQACIQPPAVLMIGPTVGIASAPVRLARRIGSMEDPGTLALLDGARAHHRLGLR